MTACACGKPIHKGMCSARWAVRKANNGPTGMKPKTPDDPGLKIYGDLAEDVILLRNRGHDVARFKGQFRVDRDVMSEDRLRAMARLLRSAKPATSPARAILRPPTKSCGSTEGRAGQLLAPNCEPGGGEQSQPGETHKDRKTAGTPAMAASGTVGIKAGPQDPTDLRARIAQLEQRVEFLFAVVADAISGRRETLIEQASGLAKIEAELRNAA